MVIEYTRSSVKTKSKLTNFKNNSRIEGYNGKQGLNPQIFIRQMDIYERGLKDESTESKINEFDFDFTEKSKID